MTPEERALLVWVAREMVNESNMHPLAADAADRRIGAVEKFAGASPLSAAAPAMLAALKAHDAYMAAQFSAGPDCETCHPEARANWITAREAIAAATGSGR